MGVEDVISGRNRNRGHRCLPTHLTLKKACIAKSNWSWQLFSEPKHAAAGPLAAPVLILLRWIPLVQPQFCFGIRPVF